MLNDNDINNISDKDILNNKNNKNIDNKKARIAVLVSGGGTNLEALLQAQERGEIVHGEIVLVIADNDRAYALERAKNHGVAAVVVVRKGRPRIEFEAELVEYLKESRIDVIILAGFLGILSAEFVLKWPDKILNIHPSLIPAFCGKGYYGLKVHEAALERGVKITGATVHLEILPDDTPEILQRRVMEQAEWILLPKAAEMVCRELVGAEE